MTSADYFDTAQAERDYPISASYLCKLRLTGSGPEYIKIGRRVFYSRSSFELWLHQHRRSSTSGTGLTSSVSSQSDAPITKAAVKDDEDEGTPD